MAGIADDVATKASTEAAESFVDAYYNALDSSRRTLGLYYTPKTTLPDGKTVPVIVWNGNVLEDGQAFQDMVEEMPYTSYDVQSLDCQVLNPSFVPVESGSRSAHRPEKNMSILVQVSGYVRIEEPHKGPQKQFSETFVLIPNTNKGPSKASSSEKRAWLIQNQNFRFVV